MAGAVLVILFGLAQLATLYLPDPGATPGRLEQAVVGILYAQQLSALVGGALEGLGLVALYVYQSEAISREARGRQVLMLIGFLLAFGGTYFGLDVEDVHPVG